MYGKKVWGIERTTFVIGPDQRLVHVFPKVKPEGTRLAMMVVDFDNGEMDIVQLAIQPDQLSRQIRRWERAGEDGHGRDNDGE